MTQYGPPTAFTKLGAAVLAIAAVDPAPPASLSALAAKIEPPARRQPGAGQRRAQERLRAKRERNRAEAAARGTRAAMVEPEFIAQTREHAGDPAAQQRWFEEQAVQFQAEGATFFRVTLHPDDPALQLIEAWKVRPADQGAPRFMLTEKETTDVP